MGAQQEVIRRWSVAGTNCRLDVATVDVGRPGEVVNVLQGICEYEPECDHADRCSLRGCPNAAEPRQVIEQ